MRPNLRLASLEGINRYLRTLPSRDWCRFCCPDEHLMSLRVRHCVECPKCHTCYLIAFSPYRNGAYVVRTSAGSREEYTLYCFCEGAQVPSCGRRREVKACEVSKAAHNRGYGTLDEIWPISRRPQDEPRFDVTKYVNLRQS